MIKDSVYLKNQNIKYTEKFCLSKSEFKKFNNQNF